MSISTLVALSVGMTLGALVFWVRSGPAMRRRSESLLDSLIESWRHEQGEVSAEQAAARSSGVLRGQIAEQLVPLFEVFPYRPGDARFIGKPIDFVVFDGYGEVVADRLDRLREVVFVEVKTGRAGLSTVERRIKQCIESGRVRCVVVDTARWP